MTHTDEREDTGLSYARVMLVESRAATPDADLEKIVRGRAPDPAVIDEFPPYYFQGEISSSRWDSFDTQMHPGTTLRNFAQDAADGVSFLRNHNTREDPVGQSLTGRFIQGSGNGVARTEAEFWLPTDPATMPYVTKLRSGTVNRLSVGFTNPRYICTICGKDMEQWMIRDGCPHFLGMLYAAEDAAGEQKGEPVKARAVIHDANLAEVSGVYKNATPGAMIYKARAMAQEGLLRGAERDLVQVRYHIALPEQVRQYGGVTLPAPGETDMPETPAGQTTPETEGLRFPDGRLVTLTDVRTLEQRLTDLSGSLEAAKAPEGQGPTETVRWLIAERARLLPLEGEAAELRPLAEDGRQYRADLVAQAITEGVRAFGDKFDADAEKKDLEGAPLESIKRRMGQWKLIGDAALPGGRLTSDGPGQPAEKLTDRAPAGAYAA